MTSSTFRKDVNIVPLTGQCAGEPSTPNSPLDAHDGVAQDHVLPAAVVEWRFPAAPIHARMARKWIEVWLSRLWPDEEAVANAAVVLSEVATNAVLHGIGPIRLVALADEERLHCEVSDQSPQQPLARAVDDDEEHGRGLLLAAALTIPGSIFVHSCPSGGKVVSFEVSSGAHKAGRRESEPRRKPAASSAMPPLCL